MKSKNPFDLPTEGMAEAYEKILSLAIKEAKLIQDKTGPALHELIDKAGAKLSELEDITVEQAEKIADYLKRDLREAAHYMADSGDDYKKWLAIDTELIEQYFFEKLMQAADQTTVELSQLKNAALTAQYHTGEMTGPGVLQCDHCGEQLHFNKAGHIPPCSKCKKTEFHRLLCV